MNERAAKPTIDIISKQMLAGDPSASAWVEANAGSGKTHVLTQRVLRLLLSGVQPENLLCLTYTKAAAAEMRRRVSDQLGAWAVLDSASLEADLIKMDIARPDAAILMRARTLFGHALETPGGLKINTIHAFCESVLHRFPLEAQVPFGFTVIEDAEQAELIRGAREQVLADGLGGDDSVAQAVATLFRLMSDDQIEKAVSTAIGAGSHLKEVLRDREKSRRNLHTYVGLNEGETTTSLRNEICTSPIIPLTHYADILAVTPADPGKNRFEEKLYRVDIRNPDPDAILNAFLTQKGEVPKRGFPKKELMAIPNGLGDRILAEAERLSALVQRLKLVLLVERSEALLDVLGAIFDRYEARKRARSLLDFDDLISHVGALLSDKPSKQWVHYKLDAGITHILVDESQDTNPQQWTVVRALSDEFFDGDSAHQRPRTMFAVGDKKQSIYSFQGADPALFGETGREMGMRARQAKMPWNPVQLKASFRTLSAILDAVDMVCSAPEISAALLADGMAIEHESARVHRGGSVTLWPPVRQQDMRLPADRWPMDIDVLEQRNAARVVAERIADTIKDWIKTERPLAQRGRAVTANDVLILVQSRGAVFQEVIRALKRADLPSPGSDKLNVSNHIVVTDLLALADILLNPADDLNLAAVLRSPLFDIDEDGLFALAAGRKKGRPLWRYLGEATESAAQGAYETLSKWRSRLDFERPYEFFAQVLYADGGLKKFHARLGDEVDDVLAEFLDLALAHEHDPQPSLQGFLATMRKSAISIKRELAEGGSGVRVMTVHGAKGLEAPIVFLADAATAPNSKTKPVYIAREQLGPMLIHASSKEDHIAETMVFRNADEASQDAEYWRKLYVGMTRAEDELYVTGMLTKTGKIDNTWYDMMDRALSAKSKACAIIDTDEEGLSFPADGVAPAPITHKITTPTPKPVSYDVSPLAPPVLRGIIRPSSAYVGEETGEEDVFETAAEAVMSAEHARKQGIALHALLQHLSKISIDMRPRIALRALDMLVPELNKHHESIAQKALSILHTPENERLFGSNSRAEVPFLAHADDDEKPRLIAGRIDRLIVEADHVLAVDYKSDANPPSRVDQVPRTYIKQLGLYALVGEKLFAPRAVQAAIFWTETETLMQLPEEMLGEATRSITVHGQA